MQQYDNTGASQLVIATVWENGGELFRLVDQTEAADLSTTESIFKLTCIAEDLNNAIDHARAKGHKAYIVDEHGKMPAWSQSLDTALAYSSEIADDISTVLTEIKDGDDLRRIKASLFEIALDMIGIDHAEQVAKHKAKPIDKNTGEDRSGTVSADGPKAPGAGVVHESQISYDGGLTWITMGLTLTPSIIGRIPVGTWTVRTRAISALGLSDGWSDPATITVTGLCAVTSK